jgi:transcriptional regulator with XRE-family HTH domain
MHFSIGTRIREERLARHWSLRELAVRAGLSVGAVQAIESGRAGSVESAARLADALALRLEMSLVDPRRRQAMLRQVDLVHSAMGELEAAHLRKLGIAVGLDEPYQHYQFAGRADVVAWDADSRALLHIENRTRFPNFQEMAGGYNSKRAYLSGVLANRLQVGTWRSETHVICALWSSEVVHAIRLRTESFRTLCPDPSMSFESWWRGEPPATGRSSTLVVLDPRATGRQRLWVGLSEALSSRPRYRGYAEAARLLERDA